MKTLSDLLIYLCVGTAGGLLRDRLRLPAGVLIGSLTAVIIFKIPSHRAVDIRPAGSPSR